MPWINGVANFRWANVLQRAGTTRTTLARSHGFLVAYGTWTGSLIRSYPTVPSSMLTTLDSPTQFTGRGGSTLPTSHITINSKCHNGHVMVERVHTRRTDLITYPGNFQRRANTQSGLYARRNSDLGHSLQKTYGTVPNTRVQGTQSRISITYRKLRIQRGQHSPARRHLELSKR